MGKNVLCLDFLPPLQGPEAPERQNRSRARLVQSAGDMGKLPQPRQKPRVRPLAQGHAALVEQEKHGHLLQPPGGFFPLHRQRLLPAGGVCGAKAGKGTGITERRAARQAHRGPQVHEGLVEIPGPVRRRGLIHPLPHLPAEARVHDIPLQKGGPGGHPEDIAVHRADPLSKGDRGDGSGGILPDAR